MKKATSVICVVITVFALLGTVSFYIFRNTGSLPLHIRTLLPENNSPTAPVQNGCNSVDLIDINTADIQQLAKLPGIGDVLAQRIVDYRTQHGPFHSPAELLNVPGIGEKKLENILELITTGGSA